MNHLPLRSINLVLLIMFGIALQLYRRYTGTIWMSIIFHSIDD
ncbi:MAG: type II CAAX prenyl endopeptidase Rce1 family protein [Bacillus sp. (in: firmicutes)]